MKSKSGIFIIVVSILVVCFRIANGQCYYAQSDKFDNVWVVNHNEVICFDKQSKKLGSYSNLLLGNPLYIDTQDPFRVIVFFPSSQTITILNNAIAEISKPIQLREKGIGDATHVCRSNKGGFWVFDRANWAIIKFDSGFNPSGEKIIPEITFSDSKPLFMEENKGILYIAFKDKAISRFDEYGSRMGDIPVRIDNYFTFIDGSIVYQEKGNTYQYNIESNQIIQFDLSVKCIPVKVQGHFLYFDGRTLSVYKI
jgi:hypothetical protein